MNLAPALQSATSVDPAKRRLIGGVLVSLALHGVILLLQFGVPSLGVPGAAPPLTVSLVRPAAPPAPVPPPLPAVVPEPVPLAASPLPPRPVSGMRLVDPVPAPPPPPVVAKPAVKKDKPRRARRISPPMPARETLDMPDRVITQDAIRNEFNIPLTRPEEALAKTEDIKEAQHGEDEGDAAANAAAEAELARAGKLKAALEAEERKLAEEQSRRDDTARLAALEQEREQQRELERERATALEQESRQQQAVQAEQLRAELQRVEQEKAEQQRAEQLRLNQQQAEQQRVEQQRAEQQRVEQQLAEQQRAEQQRAEQQRAEQQRAEQQRAEQQRAEQQRAEQQRAEQQRAEQQRAEQQRAEQQRAEQARADQAAADQRARQLAPPGTGAGAGGRPAGGAGGGGGGPAQIPKNMLGSDLGNRARDLVRGLDVLSGAPPAGRPRDPRRAVVGANERDLPLKMYVESWRQKLERNGSINYPRSWADTVRIDPLVNVAVRSDGSVEEVTILRSSGRADMDEAVRRIVRVNARYSPFPPKIAEKYDVIDIRRIWRFDDVLKLMEEVN